MGWSGGRGGQLRSSGWSECHQTIETAVAQSKSSAAFCLTELAKKIEAFHTNRVSLAFTKIAVIIFLMLSEEVTSWPRVSQMSKSNKIQVLNLI